MKNQGWPIVREGYPFLLAALVLGAAFFIFRLPIAFAGSLIVALYIAWFFRNPNRRAPASPNAVCSPSDGKVVFVGSVVDPFTQTPKTRVSIFMSVFDVHVNWMPVSGQVSDISYLRGKFLDARDEKCSDENERNAVLIETPQGSQVVFVQVAGWVARRIVCYLRRGMSVEIGKRIGLIRFGSRCDVYLPQGAKVLVKTGDRVLGGQTLIAELSKEKTP